MRDSWWVGQSAWLTLLSLTQQSAVSSSLLKSLVLFKEQCAQPQVMGYEWPQPVTVNLIFAYERFREKMCCNSGQWNRSRGCMGWGEKGQCFLKKKLKEHHVRGSPLCLCWLPFWFGIWWWENCCPELSSHVGIMREDHRQWSGWLNREMEGVWVLPDLIKPTNHPVYPWISLNKINVMSYATVSQVFCILLLEAFHTITVS